MDVHDLLTHIKKYWNFSIELYKRSEYSLATFFAITTLEEVGKLHISDKEDKTGEFDLQKEFLNHNKKYYESALSLLETENLNKYGMNTTERIDNIEIPEIFII